MTEIKGGSDLGTAVETIARPAGDGWLLTGDKYFTSNAGAELAVVAARPEGAAAGRCGAPPFLVSPCRHEWDVNTFLPPLDNDNSTPLRSTRLRSSWHTARSVT